MLIEQNLSDLVLDCCYRLHDEVGCGLSEKIYRNGCSGYESLSLELMALFPVNGGVSDFLGWPRYKRELLLDLLLRLLNNPEFLTG